MALISTIQELRQQLPRLLSKLSNNAMLPNLDRAQRKYLTPVMGVELLNDLQAKYTDRNTTPLSALYTSLVALCQLPLAAYAVLEDLPFAQSTITDAGIRTASSTDMQAAHAWEYNEIKAGLQDTAIDGIEQLLTFLFANKADLGKWTASDQFKEWNNLIIKTGSDFAKQYPLYSPYYTFYSLLPIMRDVEENYVVTTLGRDLTDWIRTQDKLEIQVPSNGTIDILKVLKKAVAFLTIKHACEHYTPRFDRNGFTVVTTGNQNDNNNAGRSEAAARELEAKKRYCDRDGQHYLSKSAAYLVGVANGLYNSDFGIDFTTAFDGSPLKTTGTETPFTKGNENRNFFRL